MLPVYKKPDKPGDFTYKRMYQRPKQRLTADAKDKLQARFYPEGGHLLKGTECRVAFELTSQEGEAVNLSGTLLSGDRLVGGIATSHMGRGVLTAVPGDERMVTRFTWHDKEYTFRLPEAEDRGVALAMKDGVADLSAVRLPTDRQYGLSILCRGVLKHFEEIRWDSLGHYTFRLPQLPTGVNDLTVFDDRGNILADRLFFVNNHDYDLYTASVSGRKLTYAPYEKVVLDIDCRDVHTSSLLSVAVRDRQTDEPTYNDGDIMTDLLLSSELKGFVARPITSRPTTASTGRLLIC